MTEFRDGTKFNDVAAFNACKEVEAKYQRQRLTSYVAWTDVYSTEEELIADLKKVYIPEGRTPMGRCFTGYEFIYSFAFYVQKGWNLSRAQLTQAKRLALEIKKAAVASEYVG